MKTLVTGACGFIGSALTLRLLERGDEVIGVDNMNPYHDVRLKQARLDRMVDAPLFSFHRAELADTQSITSIFELHRPQRVVNLAAQAGVSYSLSNPHVYIDSNIKGFLNILEGCRHHGTESLVYASSSSVYGANEDMPFSERNPAGHPVALYGATKRANELMAHSYSHLFGIPVTGLRFFSVYGPWGRPDMALFLFTQRILDGQPIDVFNFGNHKRDFTYIDDIVEGIVRVLDRPARPNPEWDPCRPCPASSRAPYRIYNIGNSNQVTLEELIGTIEDALGRKAIRNYLPKQPGDVSETLADVTELERDFGFRPKTALREGVKRFIDWYGAHYLAIVNQPTESARPTPSPANLGHSVPSP